MTAMLYLSRSTAEVRSKFAVASALHCDLALVGGDTGSISTQDAPAIFPPHGTTLPDLGLVFRDNALTLGFGRVWISRSPDLAKPDRYR